MNRQTAMIIMGLDAGPGDTLPGLTDAATSSAGLLDDLVSNLPAIHDPSTTELVAVGAGETISREFDRPHHEPEYGPATTPIGEIHYLLADDTWYTPENCPPPPTDDNGATPWQWLFYYVMQEVDDTDMCFLWDFHPEIRQGAA